MLRWVVVTNPLGHDHPPLLGGGAGRWPVRRRECLCQDASASVALTVFCSPSLVKTMVTLSPTPAAWMIPTRSSESLTALPFTDLMTSPCWMPAFAAALFAVTELTRAPPPSA